MGWHTTTVVPLSSMAGVWGGGRARSPPLTAARGALPLWREAAVSSPSRYAIPPQRPSKRHRCHPAAITPVGPWGAKGGGGEEWRGGWRSPALSFPRVKHPTRKSGEPLLHIYRCDPRPPHPFPPPCTMRRLVIRRPPGVPPEGWADSWRGPSEERWWLELELSVPLPCIAEAETPPT